MQISIVSGKGGAGKTTLATRLFMAMNDAVLLDCDTEEPNADLFFNDAPLPEKSEDDGALGPKPDVPVGFGCADEEVSIGFPVIDGNLCVGCGACAGFCSFGAILSSPAATFVLAERCHDCGGCSLVCGQDAISYSHRSIGTISARKTEYGVLCKGELNIGEYSGVRIIRRMRTKASGESLILIDGPPGTACSAVAAVEEADFALVVVEPTPFGVSDMAMVVEMLRDLRVPFAAVVNKAGIGDDEVYRFCRREGIEILGEIPFDRSLAEALAQGESGWAGSDPEWYAGLAGKILAAAVSGPAGERS